MKIVILAGGSGTRLWPLSRETFPKQFLKLQGKKSLLQQTIERFLIQYPIESLLIVTNQETLFLVKKQVGEISPELMSQILVEPDRRNTAPAILLAVQYLQQKQGISEEEILLVSSSDYWIDSDQKFLLAVEQAENVALQEKIVTFGVRPTRPETGYGYIQVGCAMAEGVYPALAFIEKPPQAKAEKYIQQGQTYWNSGLFTFSIRTFWDELKKHSPVLFAQKEVSFEAILQNFFDLPSCSIDYELMEKSDKIVLVELTCNWSDVGSWDTIFNLSDKDENQNSLSGNIHLVNTKNSLVFAQKRLVAMVGLEDMLVVETEDALFIGKRGQSQQVKQIAQELKERKETREHLTTHTVWGHSKVIDEGAGYTVKKIVIEPNQRIDLPKGHWVVAKGTAKVHENQSIENQGDIPLEIVEVCPQ